MSTVQFATRAEDARPLLETEATVSARLERLSWSRWHASIVSVIGTAHLFDSFDALTLAFVLPVLIGEWGLSPQQAGALIAAGYLGQTIGSVLFGIAAERFGRRSALRAALALLAAMSLCSAFATGFAMLMAFRLIQGLGLGGESPAAAAYINEICPSRVRGRAVYALQTLFTAGVVVASFAALWLIPRFGWQSMFYIGALPILPAIFLSYLVPESPRWLAGVGRLAEAGAILDKVEQAIVRRTGRPLPEPVVQPTVPHPKRGRVIALFERAYVVRTLSVWMIAFCTSITGYGIVSWMPTLFLTVYRLPLEQSLGNGLIINIAGLLGVACGIFLIDWLGRRRIFMGGFTGAAAALLYLWLHSNDATAATVLTLSTVSMLFMSVILSGIHAYIPELYPTRMRSIGTGAALAWYRVGSMVGPIIVGALLTHLGISNVFLLFAGAALFGAIIMLLFGIETKGRVLEDISA